MSESRAKAVDEAVDLIQQAAEKVGTLNRTPAEAVTTDGIVVMLESVIERIEALKDDKSE
jgi:hypothetical protein